VWQKTYGMTYVHIDGMTYVHIDDLLKLVHVYRNPVVTNACMCV